MISSDIIAAYNNLANRWEIVSPNGSRRTLVSLQAFIDDTSSLLVLPPDTTDHDLARLAQHNIDLWNGLIHATGGALNGQKSHIAVFKWIFDQEGRASLVDPQNIPVSISLQDYQAGHRVPLRVVSLTEAVKLLGVRMTQKGDTTAELENLHHKCLLHCRTSQIHSDESHARMHYYGCYLPSACYSLPATPIPLKKLAQVDRSVTRVFLQKFRFAACFPRAIAFSASRYGGVGMRSLSHESSLGKITNTLRHLRSDSTVGKVLATTIDHYQLIAGLSCSVLEDTRPLCYTPGLWIDSLRESLHHASLRITNAQQWTQQKLRVGDCFLMEELLNFVARQREPNPRIKRRHIESFQRCRLYLQISRLSEICNHQGTHILPSVMNKLHPTVPG
jgi:hypothetical protein